MIQSVTDYIMGSSKA